MKIQVESARHQGAIMRSVGHVAIRAMIGLEPVRPGRDILWGLLWLCVL